jgi:hypothetical protein
LVHKWRISQESCLVKVLTPTSLFYEEVTSEQSSTKKGLLYTLKESHKEYFHVSLQGYSALTCCHEHKPQEPQRSMALLGCWGRQLLKDMMSFGTDFEMLAIWWGYVEEPTAKVVVAKRPALLHWAKRKEPTGTWSSVKSAWESPRSCHRTSNNQPLFMSLEIPWEFLTQAVPVAVLRFLLAEAYVTQESRAQGLLWVRKVRFAIAQWTFAWETFGKRQKGERSPLVILLPGSCKHLALGNWCVLHQKHEGACTMSYLGVPKVQKNGTRNQIPVQPRKVQIN